MLHHELVSHCQLGHPGTPDPMVKSRQRFEEIYQPIDGFRRIHRVEHAQGGEEIAAPPACLPDGANQIQSPAVPITKAGAGDRFDRDVKALAEKVRPIPTGVAACEYPHNLVTVPPTPLLERQRLGHVPPPFALHCEYEFHAA